MITEADRYVYLGRLKAYLNKFQESLDTFSEGISRNPDSPHLYRHRAHRHITLRDWDSAIADFERAIELVQGQPDEIEFYQPEVEEDIRLILLGRESELRPLPQPVTPEILAAMKDVYKSTLHSSIWYHYALAFYLKGDYARAAREFRVSLDLAVDDDMYVAAADWTYMSLRRDGRDDEAAEVLATVRPDMHINEPSYFRRLLMYQGRLDPAELLDTRNPDTRSLATQGYGLANWHFYNGRREDAFGIMQQIIEHGSPAAFGYMAAELDLQRHG